MPTRQPRPDVFMRGRRLSRWSTIPHPGVGESLVRIDSTTREGGLSLSAVFHRHHLLAFRLAVCFPRHGLERAPRTILTSGARIYCRLAICEPCVSLGLLRMLPLPEACEGERAWQSRGQRAAREKKSHVLDRNGSIPAIRSGQVGDQDGAAGRSICPGRLIITEASAEKILVSWVGRG
jgi:hypothetical protein